jgi:hypothetical protein
MRKLRCLVGLHRWQLVHNKEEGFFWRRCRDCGKERWPETRPPWAVG